MKYSADQIDKKARINEKANRELIKYLKKKPPRDLDEIVHVAHERAFKNIDCLTCANCCRSLGPRIRNKDIENLSKYLKIKPSGIVDSYLRIDEDGDYVFKQMPCPFLQTDNKCGVYDFRPRACREYPHTDRKKIQQILDLTLKNSYVCPAVIEILDDIRAWKAKT